MDDDAAGKKADFTTVRSAKVSSSYDNMQDTENSYTGGFSLEDKENMKRSEGDTIKLNFDVSEYKFALYVFKKKT